MPQMSPLNWLLLSTLFIMLFFLLNNVMYFFMKYKPKTNLFFTNKYLYNWKW